jgi:hypothetical protein
VLLKACASNVPDGRGVRSREASAPLDDCAPSGTVDGAEQAIIEMAMPTVVQTRRSDAACPASNASAFRPRRALDLQYPLAVASTG